MNDRREPTISGLRVEADESNRAAAAGGVSAAARPRPQPAPLSTRQAPVIVKSKLAPLALVLAFIACGAAGYLYTLTLNSQALQADAEKRLVELEQKLTLSGDEADASLATIQASLKEAHSEIRKLWGVAYDRNRKAIADNEAAIKAAQETAGKLEKRLSALDKSGKDFGAQLALINDVVDAQQAAISNAEKSSAKVTELARQLEDSRAKYERTLGELQKQMQDTRTDIEAINGFRRSINQQLLDLRGTAPAAPAQ